MCDCYSDGFCLCTHLNIQVAPSQIPKAIDTVSDMSLDVFAKSHAGERVPGLAIEDFAGRPKKSELIN